MQEYFNLVCLIPKYSAQNITSSLPIYFWNIGDYVGILVILQAIFNRILIGIRGFSYSDVNRETTSNDTIVSSSEMVILDISFLNCVEFVTEKPFWFCRGERIFERNLKVLYKAELIEVTIGLRGWLTLWCLMDPLMDGGIASLECSLR